MSVLDKLQVWLDPQPRPGPAAMAVDEWLLETSPLPVLRVYGWQGAWGSVGYFGKLAGARAALPDLAWVRRRTGGGTVDHRADWTYSLVVPAEEGLCRMRAAESYRIIHTALIATLAAEGIEARMTCGAGPSGETLCFRNPVGHDLVDLAGRKLAGAGQRRTKQGMLHQGSLALPCPADGSARRSRCLAAALSGSWQLVDIAVPPEQISQRIACRYGNPEWTHRC
jgi:lipoyl(octanoyl) transferase